jgi:hypothetical protein
MTISMTPIDEGYKLEEYLYYELRDGKASIREKNYETTVYQFKGSSELVTIKYITNGNPLDKHSCYIIGTDAQRQQIEKNMNEYFSKKN